MRAAYRAKINTRNVWDIMWGEKCHFESSINLIYRFRSPLKRSSCSPIRLTQDKVEFWFEFCNFAMGFSVYCLAFNFELNNHKTKAVNKAFAEKKQFYIITKSKRALWLVNQLWVIVPVNPRKNHASSELLYKSNRPQVSVGYRLINHLGCW